MANQRLGAVADLTSVLDTLSKIEREETRSKERIAMQNIRESAATKRQQLRDDRAYKEQKERDVYTHNKALLGQYSESDLNKDAEGFYFPKSGQLTFDKQAERVANLEDAIGVHGINYGGDLYSAYRTSVQRGAAFAEDLQYKGDESPGVLTVHDIDMIEEKIIDDARGEYGKLEGIDWEGFGRGVKSGIAANKRIMSADSYQDYLKARNVTTKYSDESKTEEYTREEDIIYQKYTTPIYSALYMDTERGLEKTDATFSMEKQFLESKAGVAPAVLRQYEQAMYDMWGNPQATDRSIIEGFIKWDKKGRSKSDISVANEIFSYLGMDTQYKSLQRLVTTGDETGQIDKKRLKLHFDATYPQEDKLDSWSLQYPNFVSIFDQAVSEGSIGLDHEIYDTEAGRQQRLIINVKNEKEWDDWMDVMYDTSNESSQNFNQRSADAFKEFLDHLEMGVLDIR